MSDYADKLSAFLDGELPKAEADEIEAALADDPALLAEMEALVAADDMARKVFAEGLDEPVPDALVDAIRMAEVSAPANLPTAPRGVPLWITAAAACVMLTIGGVGGYVVGNKGDAQVAAAPGWLVDIADYHGVYAKEQRHLVEVGADETDHIVTWLSASVGADVSVPDLSANGLTFEGARLLVAAGKPVAQLMYKDAEGGVVALCQIASAAPNDATAKRTIGGFEMVSWGGRDANFVIVGDEGRSDLDAIAEAARQQV